MTERKIIKIVEEGCENLVREEEVENCLRSIIEHATMVCERNELTANEFSMTIFNACSNLIAMLVHTGFNKERAKESLLKMIDNCCKLNGEKK